MDIGVVDLDAVLEIPLDPLGGHRRPVIQLHDLVVGSLDHADAEHRQKAHGIPLGHDQLLERLVEPVDPLGIVGDQQLKVVLAAIARQAASLLLLAQQNLADLGQQDVAGLLAVPVAEQLEVFDVQRHHAPLAGKLGQLQLGEGVKIPVQQQARQVVPVDRRAPGDGGPPQLALLLDVDIVHVGVDHALGHAALGPGNHHLADPQPFAVHRPVAQLLAEHPGNLRLLQALAQRVRVHHRQIGFPVVGVDHVFGAVEVELAPVPVEHGHIVFVFHVPEVAAAVIEQVDLHQLVIG